MKNLIFYVLLGLSLMFIAACFEGKFTVEKYDPKKPANGFVYALPKTLLKIDIPYTIIHKAGFNEEGNFESKRTAELGEIKVTPIQVPDLEHRYEIKADILDSPV